MGWGWRESCQQAGLGCSLRQVVYTLEVHPALDKYEQMIYPVPVPESVHKERPMDLDVAASIAAERFHYYDRHPTAEDLMGESGAQDQVIAYLAQVIAWLYRDAPVYLARNMNIYTRRERRQYPVAPDLALFQGVQLTPQAIRRMRSWRLYEPGRPPPTFVLEVASDKTWKVDLNEKPAVYAALGATEYCLYDPNDPPYLPGASLRLWRRAGQELLAVAADQGGRIWSTLLESWLVPDAGFVRLTDAAGVRRLTQAEAERARADAERERARAEQARAEAERARADAEQARADAEQARADAAFARLRELGIDPEV